MPGPDADYQAWVTNFVTYANANLAALGLVAADMTHVTTCQTAFNEGFSEHIAAMAAKQTKDEARRDLTAAVRPLVRRLQASPRVTDAERPALGITVPSGGGPIGPPTTSPLVSIECGQRLQHTLRFVDSSMPTRRAKPPGVLGVEIWNKVGLTPPANEGELRFVAVDTNQPYVPDFDAVDGGKTAYYWLRWVNPTGERGPWSEQAAATIAA